MSSDPIVSEEPTHALGTAIGFEVADQTLAAATRHDGGIAPHVEVITARRVLLRESTELVPRKEPDSGLGEVYAGDVLSGVVASNLQSGGVYTDPGSGGPQPGFNTVTPCRVVDTRDAARGGPNPLSGGELRAIAFAERCGIPTGARALSVNLTAVNAAGPGWLRLFAAGTPEPAVSSINFRAGQTRANNGIVPLNAEGRMAVRAAPSAGSVHVVIDVNGYFE